ncbi:MAG TPA: DNA polymerase III subunit gamma/tau [Candidatus Acidoferrales bacterium]|jgi:DNA polymerase-3 subunit gamma/tau|nr:DNA polymerase III subunit gamma/tau [Candidatus Acidoferrales bacterium]
MGYQVIARKWRPQTFEDVVGQRHVTATLENAIRANRVAHAYIFSGARGVGKTTTARILAKALNCVKGPTPTPCNECDACREITAGNSLDVIEIDAASNRGIDQIRELRDMVRYAPASGRYKVIILDEAHMLTDEASNALLKTLEEPPDRVIFVMATTEPENLADTIRSRSQHFHFRALSFAEINGALAAIAEKEGLTAEPGALAVMARAAEGSLRDALSLLEQARAYCGTNITDAAVHELLGVVPEEALAELVAAIEEHSAEKALALVHRFQAEGRNLQHFCREAIRHFRNLLVAHVCGAESDLIAATPEQRPEIARAAAAFNEEELTRYFQILMETDEDLRRKPDPRLHLELGLLRLVNAARLAPLEEVLAELNGEAPNRAAAAQSGAAPSGAAKSSAASVPAIATASAPAVRAAAASASASSSVAAQSSTPTPGRGTGEIDHVESAGEAAAISIPRAAVQSRGIDAAQVGAIKAAVLQQQKFLAELVEHAQRWDLEGSELRLYFPSESRAIAEMLQQRNPLEKLRTIASDILRSPMRVCVKLDSAAGTPAARAAQGAPLPREQYEKDPIVRAMLDRFGGQVTEIKRRGEG